jgi:hypothetical protein
VIASTVAAMPSQAEFLHGNGSRAAA